MFFLFFIFPGHSDTDSAETSPSPEHKKPHRWELFLCRWGTFLRLHFLPALFHFFLGLPCDSSAEVSAYLL
ncbi:hypothetical protein CLOM621_05253 [Clostridium sp. M62/1]|nr:hypothetical protein CLOM621_05253 [Clostridium sp. M62/1]